MGSRPPRILDTAHAAGWLDKYLARTRPDKVFDGTNMLVLKREKK